MRISGPWVRARFARAPYRIQVCRAAAFAWVIFAWAGHARARDVVDGLDYETDRSLADCPSASAFREDVARQLGHDPFRASGGRMVVVRLFPHPTGIGARIEWRDAEGESRGERTFWSRDESCTQLARTVALATAIQIQLLEAVGVGAEEPGTGASPLLAPPTAGAPGGVPPPTAPPPPGPALADTPPPGEPTAIERGPREPWIAVDAGVGVLQDLGDAPAMVLPRIGVSVGRPSSFNLRFSARGFGTGADVARPEGSAHIDRFFMTVALARSFRVGRAIEPSLALGGGWQAVQVQGISAMPTLARAYDTQAFSWVVAASAGLAFVFAPRLAVFLEVESLVFRPSITVQVGSGHAARFDGVALIANGGFLARF